MTMDTGHTVKEGSLGDALSKEIARVRELIGFYRSLPNNAGALGVMLMEHDLASADRAIMSGDTISMIVAYRALNVCK